MSEDTKIVGISKDIEYMRKDIAEIKVSVKELGGVYATQVALDEVKRDVVAIKSSGNLWRWLGPTLTAILTSTVTFLVIEYIGRH